MGRNPMKTFLIFMVGFLIPVVLLSYVNWNIFIISTIDAKARL